MPDRYGVHHHASGLPAVLRADLESDRLALATLARQIDAVLAQLHFYSAGSNGWHGSASAAFEHALTALRQEVAGAAELVRAAERFTAAAIVEG
jgi:uncharacterized protein YukE